MLCFASLVFVVFGLLFIYKPENFVSDYGLLKFRIFNNPKSIRVIGIIAVLFSGAAGIYGIKRLFDKKIGLTIDSNGITDNSNASSIGLIEWTDITGIRTEKIMSTKFLLIDIVNPEKYIGKAKNLIRAKIMRANFNMYKTPLSITSNTLKLDFDKLEKLINSEFKKNKNAR